MKLLGTPDIVLVALAMVVGGTTVFLAWPLLPDQEEPWADALRLIVAVALPNVVLLWGFLLRTTWIRIQAYRWYYRFWGPRAELSVRGNIPMVRQEPDPLFVLGGIVRNWRHDAQTTAQLANRLVLTAGPRTVIGTYHAPDEQDEGEEAESGYLDIVISGYETKLTRLDDRLKEELAALLDSIVEGLIINGAVPNFSLNVRIRGVNPFLGFYLKGLPANQLSEFHAALQEKRYGHTVHVRIDADNLSVQGSNPGALVESARHYLASPTLAHVD